MRSLLTLAALGWATASGAADVLKAVPARLAPDKAYVLVELIHVPSFGGKVPGTVVLARYDPAGGDVRGGVRAPESALPEGAGVRLEVSKRPLVKGKESRLYLLEMEPDTWVIEGSGTTAFSLGSKSFVLAPGTVTDLGIVSPRPDWREGDSAKKETGRMLKGAFLGGIAGKGDPTELMAVTRQRGAGDIPIPAQLAGRIEQVHFTSGAKFGNYLGGLVNRIDGRAARETASATER